jgi:hypothetical protein
MIVLLRINIRGILPAGPLAKKSVNAEVTMSMKIRLRRALSAGLVLLLEYFLSPRSLRQRNRRSWLAASRLASARDRRDAGSSPVSR